MPTRTTLKAIFFVSIIFLLSGASPNWNTFVVETEAGGHRLGNPEAPVKLIEFISYSCVHCAEFEYEGAGPMRIAYVAPGNISIEVRPVIRNVVDLTATMLTYCGANEKFFLNHTAFLRSQETWLERMHTASRATQVLWRSGSPTSQRRHVASYLKFYEIMATRGYDRIDVNDCLADDVMADRLARQSETNAAEFEITGTPSFVINGVRLAGTHSWTELAPQLEARF